MGHILFAWGITFGALAWASALAAVPVIIHLLNRRRYRERLWAAMQFLLAAQRKNRRRLQLEQILLLVIRTLVVLLLVWTLVQPYIEAGGAGWLVTQREHKILVLDGSYSMRYKSDGKTLFQQAKQMADDILSRAGPGTSASLIVMGEPARIVVRDPSANIEQVRREVRLATCAQAGADLASTLQAVADVVTEGRIPNRHVIIITDAQKTTWATRAASGRPDPAVERLARTIDQACRITLVDLGRRDASNRAVTALGVEQGVPTVGRPTEVHAAVANFGRGDAKGVAVRLRIDNQDAQSRTIDLRAGERRVVTFTAEFADAGDHVLEVRLDADALALDDRRWWVAPVRRRIEVLCVDGRPSLDFGKGETDFLVSALAPRPDDSVLSPYHPQVADETALVGLDLSQYDCLFLANVARLTGDEVAVLNRYMQRGGALVWSVGSQVDVDAYNELLVGPGLLPVRLVRRRGTPGQRDTYFSFDPLAYAHPILEPFKALPRAGPVTAKAYVYIEAQWPDGRDDIEQVMNYGDGRPALVVAPCRRGRVAVLTTTIGPTWSNLCIKPAFLPLVHRTVSYLLRGRGARRNGHVGSELVLPLSAAGVHASATIVGPDGQSRQATVEPAEGIGAVRTTDTGRSGVYRLQIGSPVNRAFAVAMNLDTAESDLAKLDKDTLGANLGHWDCRYVSRWPSGGAVTVEQDRRSDLYRYLLMALLVLLVAESVLAWHFAHWEKEGGGS